jgi:hypothetical protein
MSYHHRHTGLSGIADVASAAQAVVTDPCLAQVSNLVLQLRPASSSSSSSGGAAGGPSTPGIGLCRAVRPLQAAVWLKRRPWVAPLTVAAIVGGIFLAGRLSR